ncbi:hypothetical protein Bca52824_045110 [Brassica carinata]|uniref:Uncharacterized protein n=1 Tax=Brassica carinata TaxID=52824 RepID=A0A8X7RBW9_BRACI|nr:hypothetical protein Bca52824_045110 [Brassica carinata]
MPNGKGWCASAATSLEHREDGPYKRIERKSAQWISSESHRGPPTSAFVKLDLVGEVRSGSPYRSTISASILGNSGTPHTQGYRLPRPGTRCGREGGNGRRHCRRGVDLKVWR